MKLIPLSKSGKNKGKYFAMVDNEDYDFLMQWNWHLQKSSKTNYAVRSVPKNDNKKNYQRHMHRLILGLTDPKIEGDHKNHNGLDNQRSNLRLLSRQQNTWNINSHSD